VVTLKKSVWLRPLPASRRQEARLELRNVASTVLPYERALFIRPRTAPPTHLAMATNVLHHTRCRAPHRGPGCSVRSRATQNKKERFSKRPMGRSLISRCNKFSYPPKSGFGSSTIGDSPSQELRRVSFSPISDSSINRGRFSEK
jgi:hypothetical protein